MMIFTWAVAFLLRIGPPLFHPFSDVMSTNRSLAEALTSEQSSDPIVSAIEAAASKLGVSPEELTEHLAGEGLARYLVAARAALPALERRKRQEGDQFTDDGALGLLRDAMEGSPVGK